MMMGSNVEDPTPLAAALASVTNVVGIDNCADEGAQCLDTDTLVFTDCCSKNMECSSEHNFTCVSVACIGVAFKLYHRLMLVSLFSKTEKSYKQSFLI